MISNQTVNVFKKTTVFILCMTICFIALLPTSMAAIMGDLCEYGDGEYVFDHATDWYTVNPVTGIDKIDPETGRMAHYYVYCERRNVMYVCNANPNHTIWFYQTRYTEVLMWYLD